MSNYTKSTNFAVKDGLSAGTAAKRVRGTEIDDEYNAIAVAVATKANINNTALTGVPTAPTAAVAVNTTQLATTAYVKTNIAAIPALTAAAVNALAYPVGSIYTSVVATNPNSLLGVGSWSAMGQGRVLMGAGGSYGAGSQGGTATETLSIAQIPSHNHGYTGQFGDSDADGGSDRSSSVGAANSHPIITGLNVRGGGQAHNNLQPYLVVYMWKRTS